MSARIKYTMVIVAALLLALMTVLSTQAFAAKSSFGKGSYAEKPPAVTLKKGPTLLETATFGVYYRWWYYVESCNAWRQNSHYNDSYYSWPHRMPKVNKGDRLTVRVWKPAEMPSKFLMMAYPKEDTDGEHRPSGKPKKLYRSDFKPVKNADGKTRGWKTTVKVPEANREYWVGITAEWDSMFMDHSWGEAEYLLRFEAR